MAGSVEGFIAVNRFGLGARPGEIVAASADPRGWLRAQLTGEAALPQALQSLPPTQAILADLDEMRAANAFARGIGRTGKGANGDAPARTPLSDQAGAARDKLFADLGKRGHDLYLKEAAARTLAQ